MATGDIIFFEEGYALCNANRENIVSIEMLYSLCKLYADIYFPEVNLSLLGSKHVEISVKIPYDVLTKVKSEAAEVNDSKTDNYFWNTFWEDLNALSQFCDEIHLQMDKNQNLEIALSISLLSSNYSEDEKRLPLRFRDLRLILNFITRIYTDYYIIWV